MSEQESIAWASGYFESRHATVGLSVISNDKDCVLRFAEAVGIGTVEQLNDGSYKWECQPEEIAKVRNLLWPRLSNHRRRQFGKLNELAMRQMVEEENADEANEERFLDGPEANDI